MKRQKKNSSEEKSCNIGIVENAKNCKQDKTRSSQGITLVALVVSIVVMLILARSFN